MAVGVVVAVKQVSLLPVVLAALVAAVKVEMALRQGLPIRVVAVEAVKLELVAVSVAPVSL